MQLTIEMIDDSARHELPAQWRPPAVEEIEVISGDSDKYAANERRDDHQGGSRPRSTR